MAWLRCCTLKSETYVGIRLTFNIIYLFMIAAVVNIWVRCGSAPATGPSYFPTAHPMPGKHLSCILQGCGSGFDQKKPDPGLCTSNEERFLRFY